MRGLKTIWAILLMAILLAVAPPALAFDGGMPDGQVVFGEDFTLPAGETLEGDLVVFGGDVTLEDGSTVEGDVVVWGGSVEVAGTVEGDMVAFGGDVHLLETATVYGDLATMGGAVEREEGAEVRGERITGPWADGWQFWPMLPTVINARFPIHRGPAALGIRLFVGGLRSVLTIVLMAGLAGLVAVLWPHAAVRVGRTGIQAFIPSLGVGLLTMIVAAIACLGLTVTICLSPVVPLLAIGTAIATIFGWAALGILIGERILGAHRASPFWGGALGSGLLTLLSAIPCLGWMVGLLGACVGLGAVVLTRFGTVDYPYPMAPPPLPPESEAEEGTERE